MVFPPHLSRPGYISQLRGRAQGVGPTPDAHQRRTQISRHLLALLAVDTLATGESRSDRRITASRTFRLQVTHYCATRLPPAGPVRAQPRTGLSTFDLGRVGL